MRYACSFLFYVSVVFFSPQVLSQSNVDGMTLIGITEFSELRRPYYLAAFYSDSPSNNADLILNTNGRRRMEIRVTSKRWSPRRFSSQWTQGVLINNDQKNLLRFDDTFVQFNNLLNEPFREGDIIIIDAFDDGSSKVLVNGIESFTVSTPGFLELLLAKWIGARPPSSEFKQQILNNSSDATLEATFVSLQPTDERVEQIEAWFAGSVGGVRINDTAAAATTEVEEVKPAVVEAEPVQPEPEPEPEVASQVAAVLEEPEPEPEPEPEIEEEPEIDPEIYALQQKTLGYLYQSSVAKRILGKVKYPRRALDRNQQDKVEVTVKVDRQGNVASTEFVKESKYGLLNKASLAAITSAGKMPPVPPGLDGEVIEVLVPFTYRLQ